MKLDDFKLAAARPRDVRPNVEFAEKVMSHLAANPKKRLLPGLLKHSPLAITIAVIAFIIITSGAVYAVSYLWPHLYTSVTSPQPSSSGRVSVIATNCDHVDTSKQYELKKDAPVSDDKIAEVVKAQCELNAVSDWASKAYPHAPSSETTSPNEPGVVRTRTYITPAMFPVQFVKVQQDKLTIRNTTGLVYTVDGLSPETKVIIGGEYDALNSLSSNDAITLVTQSTTTTKNRADCTDSSCQADITASTEKVLAIVKLTYRFDIYQAISSLNELSECTGNPRDDCPNTSSIDLYQHLGTVQGNYAEITGKITSYNDQTMTLTTTSGRRVTVGTTWNVVDRFNAEKAGEYGLSIIKGDTVSVGYDQTANTTNDTTITRQQVLNIRLLMEATNKGGPYHKY